MSQSRQLAAIMFTDIVGYTALMGTNEEKAFELLRKNRAIQKPVIDEFGGKWIKELGDGVMATFPAVSNAVYAAVRIQQACLEANDFQLRIGIHLGEVIFENSDIFGDAVNIASRLQSLAPPAGIYVSESVQRDLANKKDIRSVFVGVENLKNVAEPVKVYKIFSSATEVSGVTETPKSQRPVKSSILPEFDYDIHISYRDVDNKYDGWVTEFVEKLKQELSATLKDKLTIFCDTDAEPVRHAGEAPANQKVKSLMFIPVVSQTYCDINSPVWNREFKTFNAESKSDDIGSTIKLITGNTASRVIPVKIHDIDTDDLRLLESELTGSLRSIDFIYREEGVSRPLRPTDDEKGTSPLRPLYRNQINKLANAVKEIVAAIKFQQRSRSTATTANAFANITTTLASSMAVKVEVIDRQRPTIYLAWTSTDLKERREEMSLILQKAGFNVLPSFDCPADDDKFRDKVAEEMSKCVCSLHMLSGEFGRRFESDDDVSFPQHQFLEAKKRIETPGDEFNVFVWMSPDAKAIKPAQQEFIKYIRNHITRNMMFSNSDGPMQLVDDMRVVMMKKDAQVYDSKDTEIFFIFNQQDEQDASGIIEILSAEYPVETLNILPDGEDSYREMSTQQIPKSKLAVVYFKYAADWALPFIKQIWKQVGGASSPTPMFLVGESDPQSNMARSFKAPRVVSTIVPKETIPSEVKKVYSKIV